MADEMRLRSGLVLLVDGPYDGKRQSGYILRGHVRCADGEYVHVLGADSMCLYWVEYPVIVDASESARSAPVP